MFDFPNSGEASAGPRHPVAPLAVSVAIHAVTVTLVLALTFSDGMVERLRPTTTRAMILLTPPPVIHATPHMAQRTIRTPLRLFRAPVVPFVTAPLREPVPVPTLRIAPLEISLPLLPTLEVARLPTAPAPTLRTDNLTPLAGPAPVPAASARVVSRSSGFEQVAVETRRRPRAPALSGEGFDDATMIAAGQPHRAAIAAALPVTRSVEILSKPRPAYTDDARRQRIEGEVLLEILFAASAQVRVLRIVRGLNDGLDKNAIAAAEAIRFRPAERAGIAADSTAIVHIVFQLAF